MYHRADNSLEHLTTPAVRDLAWAIFSPPLLRSQALADRALAAPNCALALTAERIAWLQQLDRSPGALLRHLANRGGGRLGLYFESLWHFFLQQDERTELLAHNLPVRSGGVTLGEFDCIYFCRERHCPVHLELAVKFYLGHPDPAQHGPHSRWDRWLGPDTRDRMDRKIDRLLGHQIRLADRPEAKSVLKKLAITTPQREVEIKGRLFFPAHSEMTAPVGWPAGRQRQFWWSLSDLVEKEATPGARFAALQRGDWFAALGKSQHRTALGGEKVVKITEQAIGASGRPQMLAMIDSDGRETERFFVTPDGWPHHT